MANPHAELRQRLEGLNLYLVGMMGSGKSTAGRHLAELLGYRFLDADSSIEQVAGRSIPDVFASEGEAGFRQLEAAVLNQTYPLARDPRFHLPIARVAVDTGGQPGEGNASVCATGVS